MINEAQLVLKLLNRIKTDITKDINQKGISKGDLGMTPVIKVGDIVEGELVGDSYWYYLWKGRKFGKQPPIDSIKEWLEKKGIVAIDISQNSLAFLIARKIGQLGTDIFLGRRPAMEYEQIVFEAERDFRIDYQTQVVAEIEYLLFQKFSTWEKAGTT